MLYGAKSGTVCGSEYVRFGTGSRNLILLPGLGDGLRTVKGTELPIAWMYRALAKDFTVYMLSRKTHLPEGCTTRDMACDLQEAMTALGIAQADVIGVSMGGMVAQWLAIDYPERVNQLALVVTAARPNREMIASLEEWIAQAKEKDHTALMESNLRKIYSADYYRKNKWMVPILGKVTKPGSYDRFLIQAQACLNHDAYEGLTQITAKTLVIGGGQDAVLGKEAAGELAARLPNGTLHIYPQWGHGLYEEAHDFLAILKTFLTEKTEKL